jgi:uncharacterized protein (DUF433 family)
MAAKRRRAHRNSVTGRFVVTAARGGADRQAWARRIEIDPKRMLGKPVIRGTRVPVELVLQKLSEGATEDDLLEGYPHLKRADIRAAIAYARAVMTGEETLILTHAPTR